MFKRSIIILALYVFINNAYGTTIFYEGANISGNLWEYSYTVDNDSLAINIQEFSIFFDETLYQNLVTSITPTGWNALVLQPDPLLPDDGVYDALSLGVGIAPNSTESGFRVRFTYLGTGMPGSQNYNIVDPVTFTTVDSGTTVLRAVAAPPPAVVLTPVPTLSEWMLMCLSVFMMLVVFINDKTSIQYSYSFKQIST